MGRIAAITSRTVAIPLEMPRYTSEGRSTHTVRTLLEIADDAGNLGLGVVPWTESASSIDEPLRSLIGSDPFQSSSIIRHLSGGKFVSQGSQTLAAGVDMALIDLQGKILRMPAVRLMGGAVRDSLEVSGVLYRGDSAEPGRVDSGVDRVVTEAGRIIDTYGFGALKFKAGAVPIDRDLEVLGELRLRFPEIRLRIDPNGSWSLGSTLRVLPELRRLGIEWLEDPVLGVAGMARIAATNTVPVATNMCLTNFSELDIGVKRRPADIILLDIGYVGGIRRAQSFAEAASALGFDTAVHSGPVNQTGVGLAATLSLSSTLCHNIHSVDFVEYYNSDDVVVRRMTPAKGVIGLPLGSGFGAELDSEKVSAYEDEFHSVVSRRAPGGGRKDYPRY